MFLVIVASHIRPRAMIISSFTSMLRISVKDCDHRSQPDVWGNNDRKHRIKPLNITHTYMYMQLTYTSPWLDLIIGAAQTYTLVTAVRVTARYIIIPKTAMFLFWFSTFINICICNIMYIRFYMIGKHPILSTINKLGKAVCKYIRQKFDIL